MHLFRYLVHVANVGPLVRVGVYAHADQLPQLKDRDRGRQASTAPLLLERLRERLSGPGNLSCADTSIRPSHPMCPPPEGPGRTFSTRSSALQMI